MTVTPDATLDLSLSASTSEADCEARTCVGHADNGYEGDPETIAWLNAGSTDAVLYVTVDTGSTGEGSFSVSATVGAAPQGDTCASALALTAGTPATGLALDATFGNDYATTGTGCASYNSGVDRAFSVDVPAGQRVLFTVTPSTSLDVSLSVAVDQTSCDGRTCVASADDGFTGDPETASYFNATSATQTVYLVVDTGSTGTGTIDVLATVSTPPAGDTCGSATTLTAGTALTAQPLDATFANDYTGSGTGCASTSSGADRAYALTVPAGKRGVFTVTPATTLDVTLSVTTSVADCAARTCVANANAGTAGVAETTAWVNRGTTDQTVYLVVDTTSTGTGTFDVLGTVDTPPAGDTCAAPLPLTSGTPMTGVILNSGTYSGDYTGVGTGCSAYASGVDAVFTVDVPAGQRASLTVTPGTGLDVSVSLATSLANCSGRVCVAGIDNASSGGVETASWSNATNATVTLFVVVDTGSTGSGTFDIQADVKAPAAGDTCDTAVALSAGATLMGEKLTAPDFAADYSGLGTGCSGSTAGLDRAYSLTVPAGQRVSFTATPATGLDVSLSLTTTVAACAARTCVAGVDAAGSGAAETLTWTNDSGAAQVVYLIVDTTSVGTGTFDLATTVGTPSAGDACSTATTLTVGTPRTGEALQAPFVGDYSGTGSNCASTASSVAGVDRVYAVQVPAGQRATVTATPGTGLDVTLSFAQDLASCSARTCAGSRNAAGAAGAETLSWVNPSSTAAATLYVIVDTTATGTGTYDISATLNTPAAGDVCGTADVLTPSAPLTGLALNATAASNDYTGSGTLCSSTSTGVDRALVVDVPAGQRATVTVTPGTGLDVSLSGATSTANCSARVCSGNANDASSGAAETLSWFNPGSSTQEFYVVVDTGSTGTGTFDAAVVVGTPPQGDTCANPITLAGSVSLTAQPLSTMAPDRLQGSDTGTCTGGSGNDVAYAVSVPAGQSVTVTATPDSASDIALNLKAGPASNCGGATACLAKSDTGFSGGKETATWANTGSSAATVYVLVTRYYSGVNTTTFAMTVDVH